MSQRAQSFETRMDKLARKVEGLETSLLALTLEMTRKDEWWLLPRATYAAYHLDLVRATLAKSQPGSGSGGGTGQHEPPPIESGDGGLKGRR